MSQHKELHQILDFLLLNKEPPLVFPTESPFWKDLTFYSLKCSRCLVYGLFVSVAPFPLTQSCWAFYRHHQACSV